MAFRKLSQQYICIPILLSLGLRCSQFLTITKTPILNFYVFIQPFNLA